MSEEGMTEGMDEALARQVDGGLLADTFSTAREAGETPAESSLPVLPIEALREAADDPKVRARRERVQKIMAGEPVDPPHRLRRVERVGTRKPASLPTLPSQEAMDAVRRRTDVQARRERIQARIKARGGKPRKTLGNNG